MTRSNFILFDLDGTLIDGVDDLLFAINSVLSTHGLLALDRPALEALLGDGLEILVQRAFATHGVTLSAAALATACAAYQHAYQATEYKHTRLYHGVAETLQQLHTDGWIIGLASNKPTIPCRAILTQLGVRDLFAVIAGGDAIQVKKPDAGHLLYALQEMGYQPGIHNRAVMVGDHANDVDAARAAGIAAIAVAFEVDATRARSLGADAVLTDFTHLPAALAALSR